MAEKKRIIWIDQLRGLAFYSVIIGHMSIGKQLKTWVYSYHMPLFFLISGLNFNIERMYKTSFTDYFTKLFKRMVVPYIWLQMLSFILRYLVNILGNHKEVPVVTYFKGILMANNNIIGAPSNPMYYILLLFTAQICLWCVIKIAKANRVKIGVILLVLLLGSLCTQKINTPWHINVVPTGMFLIFIGRLLMDCYLTYREKLEKLNKGTYLSICAVLLIFGYVLSKINGRISIHGNYYGEDFVIFLICAVSSSVAFAMLTMLIPHNKLLTFIGQNTFFYLSIHKPLLLVMETVAGKYEDHWAFLLFGSIFCFFVLAPAAWVANKYFPYICGNPIKENTIITTVCKYVAVAASGAVPWLYFNNHFLDGLLRSTIALQLLSAAIYAVIVVAIVFVFNEFLPFMFAQDYKKKVK